MHIHVAVETFDLAPREAQSLRHALHTHATNRRQGRTPSRQTRRDEDVDFIDKPGIEKAPHDCGASFHEDVGHPPPSQFRKQGRKGDVAGRVRQFQYLASLFS